MQFVETIHEDMKIAADAENYNLASQKKNERDAAVNDAKGIAAKIENYLSNM